MVAASIGARAAADRTSAAATGLRLCGMVEEPPRPGPLGSAASPTSTCIISEMSRAALASAPTTRAAILGQRRHAHARWVNQGGGRQVEAEALGDRDHHRLGRLAQRRVAARGAAELVELGFREARFEAARGAAEIGGPTSDLLAERERRRRLQERAAERRRLAMLARERSKGGDDAIELLHDGRQRFAELQHHGGVDHVLAGGAPMDVARRLGVALGDLVGERLHHRHGERGGSAAAPLLGERRRDRRARDRRP